MTEPTSQAVKEQLMQDWEEFKNSPEAEDLIKYSTTRYRFLVAMAQVSMGSKEYNEANS